MGAKTPRPTQVQSAVVANWDTVEMPSPLHPWDRHAPTCPTPSPGAFSIPRPTAHPIATPSQRSRGVGLTSTFSTTCFPKEHTLVETVMVMFSALLYWLLTP